MIPLGHDRLYSNEAMDILASLHPFPYHFLMLQVDIPIPIALKFQFCQCYFLVNNNALLFGNHLQTLFKGFWVIRRFNIKNEPLYMASQRLQTPDVRA